MHSIRFQFISFITGLLLILLILLNTYPITSSRDAVFEEKRSSLDGQAATLAASLSGLERPSRESVAEVLRFLDLSGFSRIVVTDADGLVIYDTQPGTVGKQTDLEDVKLALTGKTVFRSASGMPLFPAAWSRP